MAIWKLPTCARSVFRILPKMQPFMKIINNWKQLTIFGKSSILDVWKGSEYTAVAVFFFGKNWSPQTSKIWNHSIISFHLKEITSLSNAKNMRPYYPMLSFERNHFSFKHQKYEIIVSYAFIWKKSPLFRLNIRPTTKPIIKPCLNGLV